MISTSKSGERQTPTSSQLSESRHSSSPLRPFNREEQWQDQAGNHLPAQALTDPRAAILSLLRQVQAQVALLERLVQLYHPADHHQ